MLQESKSATGVIVGGGYAGVSTLVHLKERFADRLVDGRMRLLMFDRAPYAGPGLAWDGAVASDCQLSNLQVDGLRLSRDFRPSFQDWLEATYPERFAHEENLAAAFPPRRYFGEYIRAMLDRLTTSPGIELRTGMEAASITPREGEGHRVTFRDRATTVNADFVIVCTGAPTSSDATRFPHLAEAPGYLDNPWPASAVTAALQGARRVAVIGTGLTAIDVVKQIAATCPDVPILMTSRRARFNAVVRDLCRPEIFDQPPYERTVLKNERIAELPPRIPLQAMLELIKRELEASSPRPIDWDRLTDPDVDGVDEWRRRASDHEQGEPCRWQLALLAIDDVFPLLWRRLDDNDRARWLGSTARAVYQNYSNPLPYESAREVLRLIDDGRTVVRGGLRAIEPLSAAGFRLRFPSDKIDVSHCVNCTGVGNDVSHDPSQLTRQLIADRLVERHPFGGLQLDPDTLAARRGLYFIGNNAKGVRYVTSGIGFVRAMVAAVIDDVAATLHADTRSI